MSFSLYCLFLVFLCLYSFYSFHLCLTLSHFLFSFVCLILNLSFCIYFFLCLSVFIFVTFILNFPSSLYHRWSLRRRVGFNSSVPGNPEIWSKPWEVKKKSWQTWARVCTSGPYRRAIYYTRSQLDPNPCPTIVLPMFLFVWILLRSYT